MPKLVIDLSADGSKLESQFSDIGRKSAQKFERNFDSNVKASGLSRISNSLTNMFNKMFGRAGEQSGTAFQQGFQKSGAIPSIIANYIATRAAFGNKAAIGNKLSPNQQEMIKHPVYRSLFTQAQIKNNTATAAPVATGGIMGAISGLGAKAGPIMGALAVTATVGSFVKSTLDLADRLGDLSEQTGYSIDSLHALEIIAKDSGGELDKMLTIDRNLQNARIDALNDPEKLKKFNQLGISANDLSKGGNMLELLAKKAGKGKDINSILGDIIGTRNVGLFRATQGSLSDMSGTQKTLAEQGRLVDPESVMAIKEVKDQWEAIIQELQITFLPLITAGAEAFIVVAEILKAGFDSIKTQIVNFFDIFEAGWQLASNGAENFFTMALNFIDMLSNPKSLLEGNLLEKLTANTKGALEGVNVKSPTQVLDMLFSQPYDKFSDSLANLWARRQAMRDNRDMDKEQVGVAQKKTPDYKKGYQEWLKGTMMKGDELTNVGNFLGGTTFSLSAIGMKQIELQQQQLATANSMEAYLATIADQLANNGIPNN